MVALRKDVKVGFVVGGIMLAVVGVYFALSAIGGRGAKPTAETVTLNAGDASSSKTTSALATPRTPAKVDAVAKVDRPSTPAGTSSGGGGDDVWSNAFTTGDLHPTRSVTPDLPTKTSREPAAKPSDVIRAMNDPAGATPPPPQSTASTSDNSSGSMAGGTTPTLTKNPPADSSKTAAGGKTHVVVAGETLSAIAEEEYGSRNLYDVIEKANPGIDAGKLKVGQSLVIPPHDKSTATASDATTPAKASANVDATKQYVVKAGDSLHKISTALYGSSGEWQAIYDANKAQIGDSPANIKVGMTLMLPKPPTQK